MNQSTHHSTPERHPRVSVLVPIYNVERYLRECLDSLLCQTLTDIEIICINDGSTDGSRAIIQEYLDADERVRVIDKENSGYGASMNRGLDAARGTYVSILESDDFLDPRALETMERVARRTGVPVVKCDFYLYWSKPEPRNVRFGFTNEQRSGLMRPREVTDVFYLKPSIWSALYSREFLRANDIRFLETPGASYQDAGFNFKVWAAADQVFLVDKAYLHYRQDNETSSVNSPAKLYCVCDEYDEMLRYVGERPELGEELLPILVKMRYDSYMWNYDRLADELKAEWVTRMAEDFRAEDEAGIIDYELFEPWKRSDRRALMDDPERFHRLRQQLVGRNRASAIRYYFAVGGLPTVASLAAIRLGLARGETRYFSV